MKGSVAIVTGSSRGIGRAIAERLAREGARLVLGYRRNLEAMERVEQTCKAAGAEIIVVKGDIARAETSEQMCRAALASFQRIDILVNNAGVAADDLLAVLDDEKLEEMVATNVLGLTRLTRAVLPTMLRQRSGSIVSVSSVAATRPGRGNAVYAGTKGFVESFTRALAVEVGRKGIRVNAVAPGVVETDMTAHLRHVAPDIARQAISMRRIGSAQEVASAVAFLCSQEASYVHGAIIGVDGGFVGAT